MDWERLKREYAFTPMLFFDAQWMWIVHEGFIVHKIFTPMIPMYMSAGETVTIIFPKDGCDAL